MSYHVCYCYGRGLVEGIVVQYGNLELQYQPMGPSVVSWVSAGIDGDFEAVLVFQAGAWNFFVDAIL